MMTLTDLLATVLPLPSQVQTSPHLSSFPSEDTPFDILAKVPPFVEVTTLK